MSLFDAVKITKGLLDTIANADVKRQLLAVLDEALAVSIRNRELEAENNELKDKLKFKAKLAFRENVLWADGEPRN